MKTLIIVLATLGCLYNILLCIVKMRSAKNKTPDNVSDVYDEKTYETWKKYSAEHTKNSLFFSIISLVITLVLLFSNAYFAFSKLFPTGLFWQLLSVVVLEALVSLIVDIPKSYISTMIIENKYGFNRSTIKTFIFDQIRSFILGLVLSTGLATIIMISHLGFGKYMALVCSIALIFLMLIIAFISPFIGRIGNKFTPLENGILRDNLTNLLASYNYQVRAIEVMDASRRTTKLNAYFVGFGKLKTIVLFDNLVSVMSPDEICAVFAHELGHGLHKDTLKLQLANMLLFIFIGLGAWILTSCPSIYTAFGFTNLNYGFLFIVLGIFLGVIQPLISLLVNALSRKFEYAADRQAVKAGFGEAMIPALKKLARDNFADLSPSFLYVLLEYSHPPIDKRISAIEQELHKQNKKPQE